MNSKLLFLFSLIFLLGCGVKSRPIPPENTALPSYIDHFAKKAQPKAPQKSEEEEKKKTK